MIYARLHKIGPLVPQMKIPGNNQYTPPALPSRHNLVESPYCGIVGSLEFMVGSLEFTVAPGLSAHRRISETGVQHAEGREYT